MAITKTEIGRLPVSRGEYSPGTVYYKHNLVQYLGSTYESLIDNNNTAPAAQSPDGVIKTNENWRPWADASSAVQFDSQLQSVSADVKGLIDNMSDGVGFRSLPLLMGQPMLLFGHGAPAKGKVPDNWRQFDSLSGQGYDWTGTPSALGQQYIDVDVSSGGLYIAARDANMGLKWINC